MTMTEKITAQLTEALSALPALYAKDGVKGDLPAVYVFTPDAAATWVLWEFDPEDGIAFGLCVPGDGSHKIRYVSVDDLASIRGAFELPVEIDDSNQTRFAGYRAINVPIPAFLKDEAAS